MKLGRRSESGDDLSTRSRRRCYTPGGSGGSSCPSEESSVGQGRPVWVEVLVIMSNHAVPRHRVYMKIHGHGRVARLRKDRGQ